jgi:hypothetical protein
LILICGFKALHNAVHHSLAAVFLELGEGGHPDGAKTELLEVCDEPPVREHVDFGVHLKRRPSVGDRCLKVDVVVVEACWISVFLEVDSGTMRPWFLQNAAVDFHSFRHAVIITTLCRIGRSSFTFPTFLTDAIPCVFEFQATWG